MATTVPKNAVFIVDEDGDYLGTIDVNIVGGAIEIDNVEVIALTDAELRATPVPVSGTVTANIAGGINAEYNATPPTVVDTETTPLQTDINGRLLVVDDSLWDAHGSLNVVINDDAGVKLPYNDLIQTQEFVSGTDFTITMDTAVYAQNDCMGGKITLTDFARSTDGSGDLIRFQLRTKLNFTMKMWAILFRDDPSASTLTNNAAVVIHADDRAKIIKIIEIAASGDWVVPKFNDTWYTFEAIAASQGRDPLPYEIPAGTGSRDLFLAFVTDGATDFVAATDFQAIVAAWNN